MLQYRWRSFTPLQRARLTFLSLSFAFVLPSHSRTRPHRVAAPIGDMSSDCSSSSILETPTDTALSPEESRTKELEVEVAALRLKLGDRDPKAIVQKHIKLLHTYNEIKDGAQALIAHYARLVQKPLRQVYEELNLPFGDD